MTGESNHLGSALAEALNRDCHCVAVNRASLRDSLAEQLRDTGLPDRLLDVHSHLFAESPVFLWQGHLDRMTELIHTVENVSRIAAYREAVLARAPAIAQHDFGPRGVFFAYDFHLGADGPQLIEINTNAGGVLLNLHLAAAQQACCAELITLFGGTADVGTAEKELMAMFRDEFRLQRPGQPLRSIAIVDSEPAEQYLYAEFLLFQSLFERHDIRAIIADPGAFTIRDGALCVGAHEVDLVYNRVTDFYFETPESAVLRKAYLEKLAVFTPSPHAYAMYADKRNLSVLSDGARLAALGVDHDRIAVLQRSLPRTVLVSEENADRLWKDRKRLFFKPVTGFGSRGAYRGSKLTRRVWQEIVTSDYVAQAMVPPSERHLVIDGERLSLKLDIRCVVYDGRIQQLSARLYRGQTTNLRTKGGGLATVFATPEFASVDVKSRPHDAR